ncbi:flavin reductase family protein [Kitasatospora sp. MAP12-44]|nr:flavin reductase family protein [Kitasatospora sp. MAP12-44]
MRHHAKGVAVITAGQESPVGFCATSLASISLDPPLLSFTVGLHSASWATVQSAPHVMVHLLAQDQEELARRFAEPGSAKFGPRTAWHRGVLGLPVLDGVLAWLALAPISRLPVQDHALVIGRVVEAGQIGDGGGGPLIHHGGRFSQLAT